LEKRGKKLIGAMRMRHEGEQQHREKDPRLQIVIEPTLRHRNQRILDCSLSKLSLASPDLVEALAADAAREVGVELCHRSDTVRARDQREGMIESSAYLNLGHGSKIKGLHGGSHDMGGLDKRCAQ
jgi:hypothetical protein